MLSRRAVGTVPRLRCIDNIYMFMLTLRRADDAAFPMTEASEVGGSNDFRFDDVATPLSALAHPSQDEINAESRVEKNGGAN